MSKQGRMQKITNATLREMKQKGQKITVLTAYDYPMASLLDECGTDVLLVGDSLGMVVLGYESTLPVTMADMLHHTRAVCRGARRAMVVADMPFLSYQVSPEEALRNAGRFLQEAGAQAVKLEGGREVADAIRKITDAGIPLMAHLGLTPQSVHRFGGYKVQGKDEEAARRILEDAKIVEAAGAFSVVLECVPASLAATITSSIGIPTIGIGAGSSCDGQVLVVNDMLGMYEKLSPRFVKHYGNLGTQIRAAVEAYLTEVRSGTFPAPEHAF
ncbi:MAG: 3-methyl-2-oxobutanoate hydroxymethyltransferase [Syntrophaceae bacterium PtaU1.Bin231]|nr:MAG: 3-methyl-2-oxobutanoate hydroxymethyltransferase [Syntrophaceae bacterium PtaU1.Bin231]